MERQSLKKLHQIAGPLALLVILVFFMSSVYAELTGDHQLIKTVKTAILFGLILLFIVMPVAVITGRKLAGQFTSTVVGRKLNRMKLIAANAAILVTLAILLYNRAIGDEIDQTFLVLQIVELAFGLLNVVLLILMIKDGRILNRKSNGPMD
jgi:hypothetical protein